MINNDLSYSIIDKTGEFLKKDSKDIKALLILNKWRYMHNLPMYNFSINLRNLAKKNGINNFTISQRLKRIPSIIDKLNREQKSGSKMKLSKMQDIGGFRIVLENIEQVEQLRKLILSKHKNFGEIKEVDYILKPRESGYRSIHLICKKGHSIVKDINLQLELQIRTKLQHYWATAVETMGIYFKQAFKASQGDTKWLEYFKLLSAAFCIVEDSPLPDAYKNISIVNIFKKLKKDTKRINIISILQGFTLTNHIIQREIKKESLKKSEYFLITLDGLTRDIRIKGYKKKDFEKANNDYLAKETENSNPNVFIVLVGVDSIKHLSKSYPNYFLDTQDFVKELQRILEKTSLL